MGIFSFFLYRRMGKGLTSDTQRVLRDGFPGVQCRTVLEYLLNMQRALGSIHRTHTCAYTQTHKNSWGEERWREITGTKQNTVMLYRKKSNSGSL
jgi:hypothetical protein